MSESFCSRAEEVFADFLSDREAGRTGAFAALCAEHPELSAELRELWRAHQEASALCEELRGGSALLTVLPPPAAEGGGDQRKFQELVERLAGKPPGGARYRPMGKLGEGGMGVVLSVFDEELLRPLAMKVAQERALEPDGTVSRPLSRSLGRFLEEAQVTSQLDHPGIVPVHELGLDGEQRVFFTMRLVQGQSLREVIDLVHRGEQGWTLTRALEALLKVCDAVAYAHSRGVIHRDLKPANVMIGQFGEVYTMDWGLARAAGAPPGAAAAASGADPAGPGPRAESGAAGSALRTRAGTVIGTPAYMAPEQARGENDAVDGRADVYALGAMLYHLLTGQVPYSDATGTPGSREILRRVVAGPPAAVHVLNPRIPAELEAICERATARDRQARYPAVTELAEDLRAFLDRRVVKAYASGPLAELRKWVLRNRFTAAALAGGVIVSVALLSVLLVTKTRSAQRLARTNRALDLARREAQDHLQGFERLQDINELRRLQLLADELWPAVPARVPAMQQWLAQAEVLAARRPLHEAFLRELQADADAATPAAAPPALPQRERWALDLVAGFVRDLQDFFDPDPGAGTVAGMRRRLEQAASLEERSLHAHADAWAEACDEIVLAERYAGLEIPPQIGLVPLGPDPDTGWWEFAVLDTGAVPGRDASGEIVRTPAMAVVLVLLPAGRFAMGTQREASAAPQYDGGLRSEDWQPLHEVELDAFFLSKYELTQAQWQRLTGSQPSLFPLEPQARADLATWGLLPVEQVDHPRAEAVLRQVGLVLPTEAQWEYAARAGTHTAWWCGDESESIPAARAGNVHDLAVQRPEWGRPEAWHDGFRDAAPVGSFAANPFGLHDVIGNLMEWCQDQHGAYTQPLRRGDGLRLVPAGSADRCIYRGGSFDNGAGNARSCYREYNTPATASFNLGIRPARRLDGVPTEDES